MTWLKSAAMWTVALATVHLATTPRLRIPGPDPDLGSYASCASFEDPTATAGPSRRSLSASPGVIQRTVDSLFETSWERVRDARRDQRWAQPPSRSADPQLIANELRRNYSDELAAHEAGQHDATGTAVSLLLELCAAVNGEDGEEGGFAAALASIDVARLGATTNSYMGTGLPLLPWRHRLRRNGDDRVAAQV